MQPDQAPVLLRFFFCRTRCTNTQPRRVLRWYEEDDQVIRNEQNADPGIQCQWWGYKQYWRPYQTNDSFFGSSVQTHWFSQKVREVEAWLVHPTQRNKMQRIAAVYPNTLCHEGGVDDLICITDFLTAVRKDFQIVTLRLREGQELFEQYSQMCLSLRYALSFPKYSWVWVIEQTS